MALGTPIEVLRARTRRAGAAMALALLVAASMASGVGTAATSSTVVTATVPSATTLAIDPVGAGPNGCQSNAAAVTSFGTVLPNSSAVTTSDCTVVFGSSNDTSMLRMYQADQRGSAMFRLTTGALDPAFNGGTATASVGASAGIEEGYAMAVQPDGKVLVAGTATNVDEDMVLARFTTAGVLDTSFGCATPPCSGVATLNLAPVQEYANGIALQPDGKVVIAGTRRVGDTNAVVARYNANGTLDTTFGCATPPCSGYNASDLSGSNQDDEIYEARLAPDGKIVVTGLVNLGGTYDTLVARYGSNGVPDTSFGPGGARHVSLSTAAGLNDFGTGVAVQPDGKPVLIATTTSGAGQVAAAARLTTGGILDTTFGCATPPCAGVIRAASPAAATSFEGIALQEDGKVVATGVAAVNVNDFLVARFNANGTFDGSFGTGGLKPISLAPAGVDQGTAVAIMPGGEIVAAGWTTNANSDFAVVRLNGADGSLDTTFDTDGIATLAVTAGADVAYDVALGSDGSLVLAGHGSNATSDVAVARYLGSPVADATGATPWAAGQMFGACLETATGGATGGAGVGGWTVAGDNNCTSASPAFNPVPATSASPSSKIAAATTTGTSSATVSLRFGFKTASNQPSGRYIAPVVFETLAPNA